MCELSSQASREETRGVWAQTLASGAAGMRVLGCVYPAHVAQEPSSGRCLAELTNNAQAEVQVCSTKEEMVGCFDVIGADVSHQQSASCVPHITTCALHMQATPCSSYEYF